MKTKLLFIVTLLFCSFLAKAQISADQTWELFYPGVKLTYHINACVNNEPEPNTNEYFWCDGPDRVVVQSFGLTHGNVLASNEFTFNNEKYVVITTTKGISIYNFTQKKWRNIPFLAFNDDTLVDNFRSAINDGNGNIIFNGAGKGIHKYSLTDNTITQITNQNYGFEQFKRNTNDGSFKNSIWAVIDRRLFKYHNGTMHIYDNQALGILATKKIKGFSIGTDDKIYLAVENQGLIVFNPADNSTQIITDAEGLPNIHLQDTSFDNDGNLWMAYGSYNSGGIIKWNIANNTFQNFDNPTNNSLGFDRIEVVNNQIWLSAKSTGTDEEGLYKVIFNANNEPTWQHFNEAFFQEKGLVENFAYYNNKVGFYDLASYGNDLYLSTTGNGTIIYNTQTNKWTHLSALKNNIPSGIFRTLEAVKQDKSGGIVFRAKMKHNKLRDANVISRLKNDVISNFPLGKGNNFSVNSEMGVDNDGNIYTKVQPLSGGDKFRRINYPQQQELLGNYVINSRTRFSVEGFNKWFYDSYGSKERLTNIDTQVTYAKDNSNFNLGTIYVQEITEGQDDRVWVLTVGNGIKWYDPVSDIMGELTLPKLTNSTHSEAGNVRKILFGTNQDELWLICQNGVVYVKNNVETHTFLKADYQTLNFIRNAKIDANNNLYALSSSGILKISNINTTPVTKEFYYVPMASGAGPDFANFIDFTIDNEGNKWFISNNSSYPKLLKFKESNDAGGITNGATTSNLRGRISGKVYVDINNNQLYDENIDGIVSNQALNVKNENSNFVVYSDAYGNYNFPIYNANRTYEIAVTSTDGFSYTSKRNFKVPVTNLDGDYSNNDIKLLREDTKSLYVKGSAKSGAWGFIRPGFENRFVSGIGNLSTSKTFSNVKVRYEFENTNENATNYNINNITDLKIFKLKRNINDHIINKLRIDPGKSQHWSLANLTEANYTKTEIASPVYTEVNNGKNKTLEIEIGEITPYETIVLEIYTDVFDPTGIDNVIQFGPTAISADNWEFVARNSAKNEAKRSGNWKDITPTSEDRGVGRNDDFSPYISPEDVYQDEDEIYRDREDVYSDAPYFTPIFSSYDPNDKLVTPGVPNKLNEVDIDKKWLTYTVRFQNNGNFSAKDVYVLDALDAKFDKHSFRFLESSHPVQISEVGTETQSIKKFLFKDIYLPDSLSSPEKSQGYLKYSIKAKENIAENTVVENTASIYFDQNPPIITNTIQNKFRTSAAASIKEFEKNGVFLYPNPAKSLVTISLKDNEEIKEITMYNLMGQRVLYSKKQQVLATIPVHQLPSGVYLVTIKGSLKKYSKKLIVN